MTTSSLPATLRAGAEGLYALEAATGLIIAHGTWLARSDDFGRFIRDIPVSLGEAITGIDDRNVGLLVKAVLRASGRGQFPRKTRLPTSI